MNDKPFRRVDAVEFQDPGSVRTSKASLPVCRAGPFRRGNLPQRGQHYHQFLL